MANIIEGLTDIQTIWVEGVAANEGDGWAKNWQVRQWVENNHPDFAAGWDTNPSSVTSAALYNLGPDRAGVLEKKPHVNGHWRVKKDGQVIRKDDGTVLIDGERWIRVEDAQRRQREGYERLDDSQKRELFGWQRGICYLCGTPIGHWLDAHIEHKQARADGGETELDSGNIALAHGQCNSVKGTRSVSEARMAIGEAGKRIAFDIALAMDAENGARRWAMAQE